MMKTAFSVVFIVTLVVVITDYYRGYVTIAEELEIIVLCWIGLAIVNKKQIDK